MPVFNFNIPIPGKRSFFDDLKPELPDLWKPPQLELGTLPEQEEIVEAAGQVSVTPPVRDISDVPSAVRGFEMTKVFAPKTRRPKAELRTSTPPEAATGQEPASVFTESPMDAASAAIRNQGGLTGKISGYEAIANKLKTEKAIAAGGDILQSRNLETQKVPVRFSVNIPQGTIGTADQVRRAVLQGAGMRADVVDQIEAAIGAPLLSWTPDKQREIEMTVNFYRKPVTKTMAEAESYKGKQLYRYSSETNVPRSAFAIYDAFMRGGPDAAREAYGQIRKDVEGAPASRPVTEAERAFAKEMYAPPSTMVGEMANRFAGAALKLGLSSVEGGAEIADLALPEKWHLAPSLRGFTDATQGVVDQIHPVDPRNTGWSALIPEAFGTAAGFMAGGGLLRAPKAASAILGAATNAQQVAREFDVARAAQAYPDRFQGNRDLTVALAAGTGALEAFGIEGRMGQFGTRSKFLEAVKGGVIGEGVQESVADVLNDLNAVYGGQYDKKRDIGKGMMESFALGAVVGTGFEGVSFLASKLADRRERLAYAAGVAQQQPDSPLGQVVNQAGVTLETIEKADDKTIDEFTKRIEVWAWAEVRLKRLQLQREQLAAQTQGAEAKLRTGRVPTGPELQVADQVAQLDEQIAQTQLAQDETVAEMEEKASPLFRRLRDAAQSEQQAPSTSAQAPSIGVEAPSSSPEAVSTPGEQGIGNRGVGSGESPLFRRIAEAVAASRPAVETITDVQEGRPDLLAQVRREGGMTGDVEAGELRRIGLKEGGTTGLVQRTGLSPDEMRERMVSEGLSQAETATDFIQEVEEELRRQKQGPRAETSYEDYARAQMSESEREQSDRFDALLRQPENPFTQAFQRLDNPKIQLSRELVGEFIEEAEREGFDDDFIESWLGEARARRGMASLAPVGTASAQPQSESLSQLERELEAVDRRIADKRSQGEETADDWAQRRRVERQVEEITGKPVREYPRQLVPEEPAPPERANVIPEWIRGRNVYRMRGDEATKFVNDLRAEKARQEAAGPENVDRGLWVTTRMMLRAAEERRAELKKDKTETVPPLNDPRRVPTKAEREASQRRATAARKIAERSVPGAGGQYLSSEQSAAELEAERQLKPLARAVGASPSDETKVKVADLGLESKTAPARPADAAPTKRSVLIEDISLGRDDLSRGRMNQVQEALKGGVKPERKGVPRKQQIDAIEVVPDPNAPGKWIVDNDGNHRVALLKLQGFKGNVPVTAFEAPAGRAGRTVTVGDKQYTLTSEQEARWKTEVDEPLKYAETHAAELAKLHGRERAEKYRKGEAMRIAAVKRQIVGALTEKEQAAKERRDQSAFKGKKVSVEIGGERRNATVIGTPFGKVKVRLDDGRQVSVERDQVLEPIVVHPNPKIDRQPIIRETNRDTVIVPNPENVKRVSEIKDRSQEPAEHKFSSTQINLPKEIADKILAFGRQIPDADLADNGREDEPHVTIKYGLHGWDSKFVEDALKGEKPVTIRFGKVSLFTTNPDYDVVTVDVESAGLRRLNKKVSEAQPNTETHPEYKPHVTIAYVKKGKGAKYIGNKFLEGRTVTLDSVTFSGRDGERVEIPLAGGARVDAIPDAAMDELRARPKFDKISPEALKHGEDLASRWTDVAGRLTDFNSLVKNARAEYRRDPKNPRAGVIYINSHARRIYELMLTEALEQDASFLVMATPRRNLAEHRRMIRHFMRVSQGASAAVKALRAIDGAIKKAQADKVDGVVFFDVHLPRKDWEHYASHEGFHVWQYGAPEVGAGWVESQPGYDKIRAELLARNYSDDPAAIAREWAAYAVTDDLGRFGFTRDETKRFLHTYFREIANRGGIDALNRVGNVSPDAQSIIEHQRWRHARGYSQSRTTEKTGGQESGPPRDAGPEAGEPDAGRGPAGDRVSIQGGPRGGRRSGSRTPDGRELRRDQPARSVETQDFASLQDVFADLPTRGSISVADVASPAEHFYHAQTIVKERGKRGALVYMNDHAKMVLSAALEEAIGRRYYNSGAFEISRESMEAAVKGLESEASANPEFSAEITRAAEEWRRLLDEHPKQKSFTFHDVTEFAGRRQAAIPSDREAAARRFKQTSRHERVHWSQRQIVGGQGFAQVGSSWAQSTKGWGRYRRALLDRGYPDNLEILAAELAAHIAAEQYEKLKLKTEAEIAAAEEWLAKYFERVADRYGIEALDKFGSLLAHAGRAREKAGTNVRTRQAEQSVVGAEAGAGGAAGDRPPPPGGGGGGIQGGTPGGKRRPGEGPQGVRQTPGLSSAVPSKTIDEPIDAGEMSEWQRGLGEMKSPASSPDEPVNAGQMPGRQRGLGRMKSPASSPDEAIDAGAMPAREPWLPGMPQGRFDQAPPDTPVGEMPEEQQALIETKKERNTADFLRTVGDLWHLPKSLMSSGDLSAAGRQALFVSLPPTRWHLAYRAFKGQLFSLKKANYDQFVKKLRAHKAYQDAKAAGLYLASDDPKGGPISEREENFVSEMAQKAPHVRWSEQAYKTYLDSIRLDTFTKYKKVIDKQFRDPAERFEAYQAAAEWLNTSTGRGRFHGRFGQLFDKAVPFLNIFFYAPRYAASRIQMLNPLTYARNLKNPRTRVVFRHQMSELFQTAAMLGTVGALAHAAGASISFDDEDSDFFKIRFGSTRYDVMGGLQQVLRLALKISRWAASELTEEDEKVLKASRREQGKDALKYLRGKFSPLMGFIADWLNDWTAITGERHAPGDFMTSFGEDDYAKMADDIANDPVISQAMPMLAADLVSAWYNGYRNTGDPIASMGRAAKVLPAGLGLGVADYDRPEYSKPVRKALKQYGIEPRYPQKKKYETEKEHEARIPQVIQEQSAIIQEFQKNEALKGFSKEIQRKVLTDAIDADGRERMQKLRPEWLHKDWQTRAAIEEWKLEMEKNPVFQRMSGAAKEAAMESFTRRMSEFKAQAGKKPRPPRPLRAEMVRKIIAKSLSQ